MFDWRYLTYKNQYPLVGWDKVITQKSPEHMLVAVLLKCTIKMLYS